MAPTTSVSSCLDIVSGRSSTDRMRCPWSWLVGVIFICPQCLLTQGAIQLVNNTLSMGDKMTIKSDLFPACCTAGTVYVLRCTHKDCGFDIVFSDMDLPQKASLTFHGGLSTSSPIVETAVVEHGAWRRPSLVYNNNHLTIAFKAYESQIYPTFTGFKMHIETFNKALTSRTASITSVDMCGSVRSLSELSGGEVKLTPISGPNPAPAADCVWVLHNPASLPRGEVFVRLTYTNDLHGILDIRKGSHSEAPELFYVDSEKGAKVVLHGREGFTSSPARALYFRMRKPSERGSLTFVYGIFERHEKPDKGLSMCWLGNGTAEGFYCDESGWCIPYKDKCDGVRQCPSGEDERGCPVTVAPGRKPTTPTPTPIEKTTKVYCPYNRFCPDGSCQYKCPGECFSYERLCDDGTCVPDSSWSRCPGECNKYEKKCPDNSCVSTSKRCPGECFSSEQKCESGKCIDSRRYCDEEPCPSHRPYRCGDKCWGEDERCDEYAWCDNSEDEMECRSTNFPWYAILIVAVVVLGITAYVYSIMKKSQRRRQAQQEEASVTQPITAASRTAGGRPRRTSGPVTAGATPASGHPSYSATASDPSAPTAPLAPSAPPSYTEAMETRPTAPPGGAAPMPPPYEDVATENPPKVAV